MKIKDKKSGQYRVDSEVRRRFGAAAKFRGVSTNQAVEDAMRLYTDKFLKETKDGK